jgi:hypothetical protein
MCLQGIGQLQQSSNHYCVVQCASARRVIAIKPSVSHPARSLCRLDPPPAAVAIRRGATNSDDDGDGDNNRNDDGDERVVVLPSR